MTDTKVENVVGALSLTLSDMVLQATQSDAPHNITAAGMTLIGHVPGLTIHELSRGLGLSHAGTVRLVDRMVAEDLVKRGQSKTDGRAVALYLTQAGKKKEGAIHTTRQGVLHDVLSSLPDEEREAFGLIAEKLLMTIVQNREHALKVCRLCDSGACTNCPVAAQLATQAAT